MLKDFFVKQGLKEAQINDFIRKKFPLGDYSKIELQRTPLGIKIVIYTNKPGRIIGKGGSVINEMTDAIRDNFDIENPQLDVKAIENPDLDAKIVAKQISSSLERGYNYKKIGNLTLKRVMDAGAIGVQIIISGKVSGGKAMRSKFIEGYIKQAGQPVKELVDSGFETAQTNPGIIGITVKIMRGVRSEFKMKKIVPSKPKVKESASKKGKTKKKTVKKSVKKSTKNVVKKPTKKILKKPKPLKTKEKVK
ncbi:MAG: 30S ribosomal protein S3 [Candidatus Aenigmarchaeota archaeon]|nr:30S ribosomal protein S3 [Candidatus Aenigmarchaeota archaeon]